MKPFAFRQRIGKLNWKDITSVDLELIVDQNHIHELQSIIDNIIFSDIQYIDIKSISCNDIKKLINIMQYMLEYLLYCQESQLQFIRELSKKNKKMKLINKELNEINETNKEDIRIYKRQIHLLKVSIEKYKQMVLKNDGYVAVAPRIFNPLSPLENGNNDEEKDKTATTPNQLNTIIESMLRHERQTRDYVREILDEQRTSLLREFDKMTTKSDTDQRNSLLFEQQLNTYIDRITQKIERVAVSAASNTAPSSLNNEMESRLYEISTRERRVLERERELQDQLYDLELKIKHFHKQQQQQQQTDQIRVSSPPVRSIGVNTTPLDVSKLPSEEVYRKGIILASHLLARKISFPGNEKNQIKKYFQKWKNNLFHYLLKLNKSYLKQQDLSTNENIELRKVLNQTTKEYEYEIQRLNEMNKQLEKKITSLSKGLSERIVIPSPHPIPSIQVEEVKKRGGGRGGYVGPTDVQMMADALERIQQCVTQKKDTEEEIMNELAGELLERIQIREEDYQDDYNEEEKW